MHSLEDLFAEYMKNATILEAARQAGVVAILLESSRPRGLLYRHPMTVNGTIDPDAGRGRRARAGGAALPAARRRPGACPPGDRQRDSYRRPFPQRDRGDPRRRQEDEIVLVGAHLDSWDLGTGAVDNGVSSVEIIDLARQIVASGMKPRRTIRFVLFTGEEQGMLGSHAYVAGHAAELDNHVAAVIYDIGSGKLSGMYLNGREELRAPVEACAGARRLARSVRAARSRPWTGPTTSTSCSRECRTSWACRTRPRYLPDYHAESDTFDKVDAREAKAAEAVLAALVWDLANRETRIGPRQSRAEVDALLKATHLDDQMKAFGQWDAWIATSN